MVKDGTHVEVGGITYNLGVLEDLIIKNRCYNIPGHQHCKEVREQLWAEKVGLA